MNLEIHQPVVFPKYSNKWHWSILLGLIALSYYANGKIGLEVLLLRVPMHRRFGCHRVLLWQLFYLQDTGFGLPFS